MKRVFADSFFLMAVLNRRDAAHPQALEAYGQADHEFEGERHHRRADGRPPFRASRFRCVAQVTSANARAGTLAGQN